MLPALSGRVRPGVLCSGCGGARFVSGGKIRRGVLWREEEGGLPAKWRRGHAPFGGRDLDPEVGTTVVLLQPDPVKAKKKIANAMGKLGIFFVSFSALSLFRFFRLGSFPAVASTSLEGLP